MSEEVVAHAEELDSSNKYYIRISEASRAVSQQELIRLLQSSNALYYEVIPMNGATVSDISKIRLEQRLGYMYLRILLKLQVQDLLKKALNLE